MIFHSDIKSKSNYLLSNKCYIAKGNLVCAIICKLLLAYMMMLLKNTDKSIFALNLHANVMQGILWFYRPTCDASRHSMTLQLKSAVAALLSLARLSAITNTASEGSTTFLDLKGENSINFAHPKNKTKISITIIIWINREYLNKVFNW